MAKHTYPSIAEVSTKRYKMCYSVDILENVPHSNIIDYIEYRKYGKGHSGYRNMGDEELVMKFMDKGEILIVDASSRNLGFLVRYNDKVTRAGTFSGVEKGVKRRLANIPTKMREKIKRRLPLEAKVLWNKATRSRDKEVFGF